MTFTRSRTLRSGRTILFAGLFLVTALIVVAILAPWLSPRDPLEMQNHLRVTVNGQVRLTWPPFPPSATFPLGSDGHGRDLLSRVIWGTRYTLLLGLAVALLRFLISLPVAMLATLWPLLGRATSKLNLLGSVMPQVFLALVFLKPVTLVGMQLHQSVTLFLLVLTLVGCPRLIETIRGQLRFLLQEPFVEGASAVGCSPPRLIGRHLVPHLAPNLAVLGAAEVGLVLLLVGQLGIFSVFIGGGTMVTDMYDNPVHITLHPEWGAMLAETRFVVLRRPWVPLVPGMAFFISVLTANFIAEGLRLTWKLPETQPEHS